MKVEQLKSSFVPVIITLETQDEVDRIFAALNVLRLQNAIKLDDIVNCLRNFTSSRYVTYHQDLTNTLIKNFLPIHA